jgi:CHRD domain-containing protein
MIRKFRPFALAAVVVAALAMGSLAAAGKLGPGDPPQSKHFKATLNGFQENPSVSSTGFGEFEAELVTPEMLHYTFDYGGLEGGTSLFAHIHFAQRSVNGGVVVFLCGGGGHPDPCPNVSGHVEGDITPADVVSSTNATNQGIEPLAWDEFLRAMRAGHTYANIHTSPRWPGGEIRGQINDADQKEFVK